MALFLGFPYSHAIKLSSLPSHIVPVQFRQAEDYPVDLYYLMDLSNSMSDDKEKLAKLGKELGDEMNKITRNFRLGFGSFVDKVVMPYVSMVPEKLQEPCSMCVPPYGFRNHLPLTEDTLRFVSEVCAEPIISELNFFISSRIERRSVLILHHMCFRCKPRTFLEI